MKSKKRKLIVPVMAGVMLVGAACSNQAGSFTSNPTTSPTANNEASPSANSQKETSKEPLKLTIDLMGGPKTPDSWAEKALEEKLAEKLNRKVDIAPVYLPDWSEMNTKINLLMSAKDTRPNVLWTGETKEFSKWLKAGLVQDLTPSLQKYGKEILNYYTKDTLFYQWDASGKLVRLPGDVPEASYMTTILRKDWMDKLGLQTPKTLDEYVSVLRAFTNNDPDGNGQKDTYGFSGDNFYRSLTPFFYAYGVDVENFIKQDDGTIKFGSTMPEVKEALQLLAQLYKEGVIDPRMANAANQSNQKVDEIYTSGKVGSFYRFIDYFNPGTPAAISFKKANPQGEVMSIDPVKGPSGFSSDLPDPNVGWCFLVVTDTGKADDAVQVLNTIAMPEVNTLIKFGKEGEHYAIENGQYVSKVTPDEGNKLGLGNFDWIIQRKDAANIKNTPEVTKMFQHNIDTSKPMRDKIVVFKAIDRPAWDKYMTDIKKLREETFWGIITGKLPVSAFDDFVAKYEKMGGKQVDEEANQLYKTQVEEYKAYDAWYEKNIVPYK
ncbi:extracellular solute-binding protein [Paenibacillus hexagrammi]|uniref:Extracellular solute-binding protein n=1 Tax=Paenibacillus hexagrammi TaxID=2908839 RepID=A0ABY3SED2_9BACL|nr:extracellular solute-binding protein [Paenibacillus sp. YPD9-1]UJF31790.1 extracellular solute-binding protein [Paenibacillus sp. YPD9-1]